MTISIFRAIAGQYQGLRRVNTVSSMNVISHQIEEQVIKHRLPIDFFAGFQRFSHFPAQMRRYGRLGAACRRVYVLGVPDVRPTPIAGVEYISIDPSSPLAREWFVVVDSPDFWTVLATEEHEGRDILTGGRQFDGIWTFDAGIIERVSLLVSQVMGSYYTPVQQRNFASQNVHIAEIGSNLIERLEKSEIVSARRWAHNNTLQKVVSTTAAGSTDLHGEVARALNAVFGAAGVVILSYESDKLAVLAAEGEASTSLTRGLSADSPVMQAIQSGEPVSVADVRRLRMREALLPAAQSLVAVPIKLYNNVIGVIAVGATEADNWSLEDEQVLTSVAALLGLAMKPKEGDGVATPVNGSLEQWQAPISYLLRLSRKLHEGSLSAEQVNTLNQMDKLTIGLANAVGVPKATIQRIFGDRKN